MRCYSKAMIDIEEATSKARLYASTFTTAYNEAINQHYSETQKTVSNLGELQALMPLYDRKLGKDIAAVVLYSEHDFFLYFLNDQNQTLKTIKLVGDTEGFTRDWTFNTPHDQKEKRVVSYLGITAADILASVNVPASNFLSPTKEVIERNAVSHGTGRGNQDGARAQRRLPEILEQTTKQSILDV